MIQLEEDPTPIEMLITATCDLQDYMFEGNVAATLKTVELITILLDIIQDTAIHGWEREYAELGPVMEKITLRLKIEDERRRRGLAL